MLQRVVLTAGLMLLFAAAASAQTLVARYQFDNPVTLGADSSAFGNDAVNSNVTSGTDRFGNPMMAGSFNGSTSNLSVLGGLSGYDGLPGFTFSAWVNRSSADAAFSGIVSQQIGNVAPGCCTNRLLLDSGDNPYVDAGGHADFDFGSIVIPNNQWVHLTMSADDTDPGNDVDIFVDGVFAGTHHYAHNLVNSAALDTFIGINGNAHAFQGLLDDVQIYDGSINAAQAELLFNTGLATPEPASIAMWSVMGLVTAMGLVVRRRRKNVC